MARTVMCTPMSIPPRFYNCPVLLHLAYNTPTIHQLYFWQFQIWGRHRRSAAQHTSACAYLTHSLSAKVPFPVIKCTPCEMQTSQLYHSMKWQMSRNSNHYEDREGLHPLSEQYCFLSRPTSLQTRSTIPPHSLATTPLIFFNSRWLCPLYY